MLRGQLDRQGRDEFTGQAAVFCFLVFFHGVPESAALLPFGGSTVREKDLLPDKAFLAGVVMLYAVVVVVDGGTAQIGGSRAGGSACTTAHDLSFQMIDRHNGSRPFCSPQGGVFASFGAYKRKWTVRDGIVHLCDKAAGGRFSQVVSKCALRDKKEGRSGFPERPRHAQRNAHSKKSSSFSRSISAAAG